MMGVFLLDRFAFAYRAARTTNGGGYKLQKTLTPLLLTPGQQAFQRQLGKDTAFSKIA
jgi:hypothetical protein